LNRRTFVLLSAAAVLALAGCDKKQRRGMVSLGGPGAADAGKAESPAAKARPAGPYVTIDAGAGKVHVTVEVARTMEERRQGLMYRTEMAEHAGMVFLFDKDANHQFWMRNTLIPLDMIFITKDFKVAGIVHSAVPKSEQHRGVGKLSRYVLEVNGGYAKKMGITAGDSVTFHQIL